METLLLRMYSSRKAPKDQSNMQNGMMILPGDSSFNIKFLGI